MALGPLQLATWQQVVRMWTPARCQNCLHGSSTLILPLNPKPQTLNSETEGLQGTLHELFFFGVAAKVVIHPTQASLGFRASK